MHIEKSCIDPLAFEDIKSLDCLLYHVAACDDRYICSVLNHVSLAEGKVNVLAELAVDGVCS